MKKVWKITILLLIAFLLFFAAGFAQIITNSGETDLQGLEEQLQSKNGAEKRDNPQEPVNNNPKYTGKVAYLTFDDGPTTLTPKVLDVLKQYNINATFFVLGRMAERYPDILKRTYAEGNMVLAHTHTHDFAIYSSFETYYEDLYKVENSIKNILGFTLPSIIRFPGGSFNHSSIEYSGEQFMPKLTEDIKEKGYYYIDWNVNSDDAGSAKYDRDALLKNVLNGAEGKDFIVVLFHDLANNQATLEALPEIIETLIERGYAFKTFENISQAELDKMVELRIANRPVIR